MTTTLPADLNSVLTLAILTAAMLMIVIGLFMLARTDNMIRIIISIEVVMKAVTLLLLFAGYVNGNFALAQAYIITMIVLEVVVAVVASGIAISIFRHNGDMDPGHLNNLNG